jgi:hypothetical protein
MINFRRIRELNENNTKKFIDERKRQALVQSRQMDQLRKLHQEQFDKLRQEMMSVSIRYVNCMHIQAWLVYVMHFVARNGRRTNRAYILARECMLLSISKSIPKP